MKTRQGKHMGGAALPVVWRELGRTPIRNIVGQTVGAWVTIRNCVGQTFRGREDAAGRPQFVVPRVAPPRAVAPAASAAVADERSVLAAAFGL